MGGGDGELGMGKVLKGGEFVAGKLLGSGGVNAADASELKLGGEVGFIGADDGAADLGLANAAEEGDVELGEIVVLVGNGRFPPIPQLQDTIRRSYDQYFMSLGLGGSNKAAGAVGFGVLGKDEDFHAENRSLRLSKVLSCEKPPLASSGSDVLLQPQKLTHLAQNLESAADEGFVFGFVWPEAGAGGVRERDNPTAVFLS